ncbi:flagellar basal body rod protein FlgC [Liquorilactobacillus satsumensis]|uniref:Flagellar basal-body rod protein FlgC n=2 Tax=Liquorilactobacillus satsumensis TaxID=259059 RepID=A0A0R1V0L8_9LACO|nr:flagellar basal body rod protein FlgC [Liquorilactobacillus satsumensis]AJA34320.1 flagellar basal-body rod protein FlgC [Liquorilactobacillus satsumensis]KRL99167.1 flagellar basal-body rod protein FlgC [Liquorilactobacillus satsumensis DSM 16230 = JCM 12392]MCC7666588.1 flagellar basal body rod protein FlgC [Liquorilactobacillus satsumensis]MCP9312881.1 flagellar basal body rod protein FlgC [Liquorilactobacillus satsumensis]MCP9329290.1 flagellar basal body rod protein FlgC [Liquorilactob
MGIFNGLEINASGLALERLKLDTTSTNIANVNTTRTAEGGPYKRKTVQFSESLKNVQANSTDSQTPTIGGQESYGVKVTGIQSDNTEKTSYDPTNPDADQNGYVQTSNVNMADEMVNMIQTMRTYEADTSAAEMNKTILKKALEISKN